MAFRNEHLSFSRLQRYEQCPLSFKLHYIDKRQADPGVALRFGKAVHAVLETLLREHMEQERDGALSEERAVALWQEAWAAAEMAGLADDIQQMPMGMQTVIPDGGGTLSGGQRQRVAIARALVRRPRLLIFDEATSALDNRTQAVVSQSLEQLAITRVVIAHRLSTVRHADQILVLERGQVREQGNFETLMAEDGLFTRMMERQIT